MINNYLRIAVATIFICFISYAAKAQLGFEYAQYDIGFGASISKVYGDAETVTKKPIGYFNFNYNATPFVNYAVEVQAGKLEGGSINTPSGRIFSNSFTSVILRGQLQAGEFINYSNSKIANGLKNLYLSTGVGFVVNHLTTNRVSIETPDFYTPGRDNSNQILIPARIGYEFKVFNKYSQPSFKIDVGYQYNIILGDALDGFEIPGGKNDAYDQLFIGIKFAIGGISSYKKSISY